MQQRAAVLVCAIWICHTGSVSQAAWGPHVRHVRLHVVQQVAAGGVLHGDAQVPGRQERLAQVHDVRVLRAQPLVQQLPVRRGTSRHSVENGWHVQLDSTGRQPAIHGKETSDCRHCRRGTAAQGPAAERLVHLLYMLRVAHLRMCLVFILRPVRSRNLMATCSPVFISSASCTKPCAPLQRRRALQAHCESGPCWVL